MATAADLVVRLSADIRDLKRKLSDASSKMQKTGKRMQQVGKNLSLKVTAPLAAMGAMSVKAAGDFEDSFANIRKTVDASESTFENMSKQMRELAKTVPTPVEELNRLGGVAGQLGVEADNVVDFTRTIAMLGDTTDIEGERAALSLSRFMNVMGTAQTDIDRLGSTIVGLGNNFAAMESEIVEMATAMAPLGNSIGLTEQQVLAFSTTIAASGGQLQAAGTAFQKTANTMKRAVIEGNSDLQTFAATAGMSASQFQEAFQRDAGQALVSFLEGLRRIQKEGGSTASVLDEIGLADQRLVREFGKVLGNLDDLNRALPQANEEWERNTALTEEARKRYKTFNSQMQIFKNAVKDLAITFGNDLIPVVKSLANSAKSMIQGLNNMSPAMRKFITVSSSLVAALGPVLWILGSFTRSIVALGPLVAGLTTGIKALTAAMLTNPYLQVATALGLIAIKARSVWKETTRINEQVDKLQSENVEHKSWQQLDQRIQTIKGNLRDAAANSWYLAMIPGLANQSHKQFGQLNEELLKTKERMQEIGRPAPLQSLANLAGMPDLSDTGFRPQDLITGQQQVQEETNETTRSLQGMSAAAARAGVALDLPSDEIVRDLGVIRTGFDTVAQAIQGTSLNLPEKMFPPGSLGFLEQSLANMRDRIREATNPQKIKELRAEIKRLEEQIANFGKEESEAGDEVEDSFTAAAAAAQMLGDSLAQALLHGKELATVVSNLAKQLASKALMTGLSFLLGGGIGTASFFGRMFGVGDALITSAGDVVQFHPDDNILAMKDFSKLQAPMGGGRGSTKIEVPVYLDSRQIALATGEYDTQVNR